jgi:hypothetical protein
MAAEARASEEAPVRVSVVRAQRSVETTDLVLPGSVLPFQETAVYARANGYVRRWRVDIGDPVKKGPPIASSKECASVRRTIGPLSRRSSKAPPERVEALSTDDAEPIPHSSAPVGTRVAPTLEYGRSVSP